MHSRCYSNTLCELARLVIHDVYARCRGYFGEVQGLERGDVPGHVEDVARRSTDYPHLGKCAQLTSTSQRSEFTLPDGGVDELRFRTCTCYLEQFRLLPFYKKRAGIWSVCVNFRRLHLDPGHAQALARRILMFAKDELQVDAIPFASILAQRRESSCSER